MTLRLVPVRFREACEFVDAWHRHHKPPRGHKFSIGVAGNDRILRGVIMVGRPVSYLYDDGDTLEVNRSATDGTKNTNSMLYAAAARAGFALGYRRIITYTQAGESGASLRGAGWKVLAERAPRPGWDSPARPRDDEAPTFVARTLWEAVE